MSSGRTAVIAGWLVLAASLPLEAQARGVEYRNGRWFDGTRFVDTTMFVSEGVFRRRGGAPADSVVDLLGGFVVPPFGDAHQHFVDPRIGATIEAQLRDGIFYVKDQGNAPILRRVIAPALNRPGSIDFVSANQSWTSPGGHPVQIAKRGEAMEGPMGAFVRDSLDPGIVLQVATAADIDRRWSYFLAGKPDFVKVILQNSEAHGSTPAGPNRGLDPALVPEIVRRATAAGLQVSAHVHTAADFRNAVSGGVNHIAHLPGGRGPDARFLLTDGDAALAARRGVTVATTVSQHLDSALTARLLGTQYAGNVEVLRRHGVRLIVGSDLFPGTAATEVAALARARLFTNLELLTMWSVTTPRAIFPERRIGAFESGYEASFLVLRADPLADFAATRAISLRVKQGVPIPMDR